MLQLSGVEIFSLFLLNGGLEIVLSTWDSEYIQQLFRTWCDFQYV